MSDNKARTDIFGANSPMRLSVPAAAKTGTTTDWRDNWTMGFTKYLVTGVWMGNTDAKPMQDTTGLSGAAPVWNSFMEAVLADPEFLALLDAPTDDPAAWEFVPPAGVRATARLPAAHDLPRGGRVLQRGVAGDGR